MSSLQAVRVSENLMIATNYVQDVLCMCPLDWAGGEMLHVCMCVYIYIYV